MNLFKKVTTDFSTLPLLKKKGRFVVDDTVGTALLVSSNFLQKPDIYFLVCPNLYKSQKLYNLIASYVGTKNVCLFPNDELIRAETLSQSKEMMANRLYVMNELLHNVKKIYIGNLSSCLRYLPNPKLFLERSFSLNVGQICNFENLKIALTKMGYKRVNKIDQSLQFAVRGDILDIFTINSDYPIRIEFFGDEVESIRYFDLARQTSFEHIQEITILPASDILLTEKETLNAANKLFDELQRERNRFTLGQFELLRDYLEEISNDYIECNLDEQDYKFYSLLQDAHYSIFDYLNNATLFFIDDDSLEASNKLLLDESFAYLEELQEKAKCIGRVEIYQDIHKIAPFCKEKAIIIGTLLKNSSEIFIDIKPIPFQANKKSDALNIIEQYYLDGYKVVVSCSNSDHYNFLSEFFDSRGYEYEKVQDFKLPDKQIGITFDALQMGFIIKESKIVYLTSYELFNEKVRLARFDSRFKEATILKTYEDLTPGDYVVHEYQGIGQFVELLTMEIDGNPKDYLKIAYHGGEFLYVPLEQFQLVRKYLGKEGISPRLSRLHSKDWENTKKRIKEKVNDLAQRLMNLYIERSKIKGYAFRPDDEFSEDFASSFPYALTEDQTKAIEDVRKDMESETPMDRLLCGDVGFGKTEVAFRAAFKAINSGKQVAILCPTTLLARQHFELALQRFSRFDIKIAVFSRLVSEKQQNIYLKGVESGEIHLIIGTHRLLSKNIHFKDLGLLIIDEEQRFGVEQKEKLKELKRNVDVLTLSATPIPRTLQISLLGVRKMSLLNTAPENRMPIQTYVAPFKIELVKELIERELGRNGQVFYLYNNVTSVYLRAAKLQKLLPGVTIGVAHGQMDKEEIQDVMMRFYKGEISVLVCTSIVENGLDIPNANMIIVEDSERYGLSQLYQIKGRVGRSDRIAYAYLFYNESKILTEKAQKRLKAIQEFSELGSGYKIAQRDLLIRGAGDILGPEQAGYIDSIGLDMYLKLLNDSVKEKMGEPVVESITVNDNISLNSYIPDDYAKDSDKINIYQEIMSAYSLENLSDIKKKIRDIYGKMPSEVDSLFAKRKISLLIQEAKIAKVEDKNKFIDITLGKDYINIKGIGNILFETLIPYLGMIKLNYTNNILKIVLTKQGNWIYDLENILDSLLHILQNHKMVEVV